MYGPKYYASVSTVWGYYVLVLVLVLVLVSHIQRIGCQPEKNKKILYKVANPARGQLNTGKKESLAAPPPPHSALVVGRKKKKTRDASTCLGP